MSFKNYIYYMPIMISIIGFLSIIMSLKINNKKNIKFIIIFNIINILYLLIISIFIHNILPIIVNFSIFKVWIISFLGIILYIISIIICLRRNKKVKNVMSKSVIFNFFWTIVLLPIVIFVITFYREEYLINHSTFLVSYTASGNGGLGDASNFSYAISDKYCKEIGVDIRYNNFLLPQDVKNITEKELQNSDYNIILENNIILVYKKKKLIHKKKINKKYFNVNLEKIYYNK